MEKFKTDPENDIAKEAYQGPSASVEAIGHGAIEHFVYAISGLVSLGALAYVFHKPAASLIEGARKLGTRLKEYSPEGNKLFDKSKDKITTWAGDLLHSIFGDVEAAASLRALGDRAADAAHKERLTHMAMNKEQGFGNFLVTHTIGFLPYVGHRFKNYAQEFSPRTNSAIAVGGIAGAAGYIGGWGKALFHGAAHGNKGKKQFERAKAEIDNLREMNDTLNKINDKLHDELVEVSTKYKNSDAAKDEAKDAGASTDNAAAPNATAKTSADATSASATAEAKDTAPAAAALSSIRHDGKLQAARAAEPAVA